MSRKTMQKLEPTEAAISYEEAEELWETRLDQSHYDTLVSGEETIVVSEDGEKLVHLYPNALPQNIRDEILDHLDSEFEQERDYFSRYSNEDGFIQGYFGLMLTAGYDPEKVKPYIGLAEVLEDKLLDAFEDKSQRQVDIGKEYYPDTRVGDTGFTSVAANYNRESVAHRGREHEPDNINSMVTLRRGEYSGAELIMPELGIAFDLHDSDILVSKGRVMHGNASITRHTDDATRVTVVPRTNIEGSFDDMEEELKKRKDT